MGLFFKAHGTSSLGLLVLRLIVGAYTLSLGIMQASNMEAYIAKVKALNIVSENTAFIAGFIFPFVLIIFGSLYIMGFFTPVTSFILAFITLLKIISRGFFPSPGNVPFNKDMITLACFILTMFAGAGKISFDVLLDKKKKRVITTETPPPDEKPEPPAVIEPKTEEKPTVT